MKGYWGFAVFLVLSSRTVLAWDLSTMFVAAGATQSHIKFDAWVEFEAGSLAEAQRLAESAVQAQVKHLPGPMAVGLNRGAPLGDSVISEIRVEALDRKRVYSASYRYAGTAILENSFSPTYEIILPIRPDQIYRKAALPDAQGKPTTVVCTDKHHSGERDYWYFWSPERNDAQSRCHLKVNEDYLVVKARVNLGTNSIESYPEYNRLPDADGRITVSILVGMDRPSTNDHNPLESKDQNAETYRSIRSALIGMGYEARSLSYSEIRAIYPAARRRAASFREEITVERLTRSSGTHSVEVTLFFGPSAVEEKSAAFHYFLKHAIENASVLLYDGHSGSGQNLRLATIEKLRGFKFRPAPNRYQIYYLNGCSTYSYYTASFFRMKSTDRDPSGTRDLDLLTSGLYTYFNRPIRSNLTLLEAIDAWANGGRLTSYQEITKRSDTGNLFSVNGDEDNPGRR